MGIHTHPKWRNAASTMHTTVVFRSVIVRERIKRRNCSEVGLVDLPYCSDARTVRSDAGTVIGAAVLQRKDARSQRPRVG